MFISEVAGFIVVGGAWVVAGARFSESPLVDVLQAAAKEQRISEQISKRLFLGMVTV